MQSRAPGHRGFTLIELLVVMTIIIILASLAVALVPSINDRQRVSEGASLLQNWLLSARQRAIRDGAPRGVRLGAAVNNVVHELVNIEQPDDITGVGVTVNSVTYVMGTPIQALVTLNGADLSNGAVAQGDFLKIGDDQWSQIINPINPAASQVTINVQNGQLYVPMWMGMPPQTYSQYSYAARRAPRLIAGETPLQLPRDMGIAVGAGESVGIGAGGDILFTPAGRVLNAGNNGKIILWTKGDGLSNTGEPTLIAVYTRTGFIAAHPVAPVPPNTTPYDFTKDGRASGI